jgi:hypothetical protein
MLNQRPLRRESLPPEAQPKGIWANRAKQPTLSQRSAAEGSHPLRRNHRAFGWLAALPNCTTIITKFVIIPA